MFNLKDHPASSLSFSPFYSHQSLYLHGGRKCQRSSNVVAGTTTSGPLVCSFSDWPPGEKLGEWSSLSSRRSTSCGPFSPHFWKGIRAVSERTLTFRLIDRQLQQATDQGGVDLDLCCSTVCLGMMRDRQNRQRSWAGLQIKVNPIQVRELLGHPVKSPRSSKI